MLYIDPATGAHVVTAENLEEFLDYCESQKDE